MIEAQRWLLNLCIACILVSVLSCFIKNEKVNISIKSVLALYILVITLNSVLGADIRLESSIYDPKLEMSSSISPDNLVKKSAEQNICNQINARLAALNIDSSCKAITLNIDEGTVETVRLINANEAAVKEIHELLGEKVSVVTEKDG